MSFTLQELLVGAYRKLGQLTVSVATGGSATTLVDSAQANEHGDNEWNNGAIFIIEDAGGASAAPEGEFAIVSSYSDSTGTFTVAASALSAGPGAGDKYGFVGTFYPIYTMIELANDALDSLGRIPLVDTNTTTAAGQTEYSLSASLKGGQPLRVDIQGNTSDSSDNQWLEKHDWYYEPATAGSAAKVIFKRQPTSGRTLRIWYETSHPVLNTYEDVVLEAVEPDLATLALVERALEWQVTRLQGGDDFLLQRLNDARTQLAQAKIMFPVWAPKKQAKLLTMQRRSVRYPGNASDLRP